jgi:undecaprenyl-diphosphatase
MLARALTRFGSRDLLLLAAVFAIVLCVWGFVELADDVIERTPLALDEWVMSALRNPDHPAVVRGPPWLHEWARDVTALGSMPVLLAVIGIVVGFLAMTRRYSALVLLVAAVAGGFVLSLTLKHLIGRPRPPQIPPNLHVASASFPSGHSLLAAVTYLTLGALLAQLVDRRRLKIYFVTVALLLTIMVGLSRVFLGVHYPSDVLAGWALGLAWALACGMVARHLRRQGSVESIGK